MKVKFTYPFRNSNIFFLITFLFSVTAITVITVIENVLNDYRKKSSTAMTEPSLKSRKINNVNNYYVSNSIHIITRIYNYIVPTFILL